LYPTVVSREEFAYLLIRNVKGLDLTKRILSVKYNIILNLMLAESKSNLHILDRGARLYILADKILV